MRARSYRPSRRMGAMALPAGLAAGLGAAVAGGVIYQKLVELIPFIYVNVLLTLGFAGALGWAVASALVWGRCRNARAATAVGVICGLAAVGLTFHLAYTWGARSIADEVEQLVDMTDPEARAAVQGLREMSFGEWVGERVEAGWVLGRGGGLPLTGLAVWLIWLVEAGILVGVPAAVARGVASVPYCERCEQRTVQTHLGTIRAVSMPALRRVRHAGTIPACLAVETGGGTIRLEWALRSCTRCAAANFVTVDAVWDERSADKETPSHRESVLADVVPTAEELVALRERFPRKPPRPARRRRRVPRGVR